MVGNRPLSQSAIAQRTQLFATLAALDAFLVLRNGNASNASLHASERTLRRQLSQLTSAANRHGAGDLFIEDDVALLSRAVTTTMNAQSNRGGVGRASVADVIAKLSKILSDDAERQRANALSAATLASGMLRHTVIPELAAGADPVCSEPAVFAVRAVSSATPKIAMSFRQERRLARAGHRAQALATNRPSLIVESLAAIAAAATSADASPTGDLPRVVAKFSSLARTLISLWPVG